MQDRDLQGEIPPDAVIGRDLLCAGCGYNLRMLPAGGRCPECGLEIEAPLPDGDFPPDAVIGRDWQCIGCGYNLRTLPVSGRCPECGMGVAQSLNVMPRPVETSMAVRLVGVSAIVAAVGLMVSGGVFARSGACFGSLLAFAPSGLVVLGAGFLRYRCGLQAETELGRRIRQLWFVAVLLLMAPIIGRVGAVVLQMGLGRAMVRGVGVSIVLLVEGALSYLIVMPLDLACDLLLLAVTRELAERVRRRDLLPSLRFLMWLIIAAVAVTWVVGVTQTLVFQSLGTRRPDSTGLMGVVIGVTGVAMIGGRLLGLVAMIWMAISFLRLAATMRDVPGHLLKPIFDS